MPEESATMLDDSKAESRPESLRLFIGGLHEGVLGSDLKERFGRFGCIKSVDIRTKRDCQGQIENVFAYMNMDISKTDYKKCLSIYNETKWKGHKLKVQVAKQDFMMKLAEERKEALESLDWPKEQIVIKTRRMREQEEARNRLEENMKTAGVEDFTMKKAVPGTPIPGEKEWIVGKFGRVLPIMHMQRRDKKARMTHDPSKYVHHVRKFKEDPNGDRAMSERHVEDLTWSLPETVSGLDRKRMGVFPGYDGKKRAKLSHTETEKSSLHLWGKQSADDDFEIVGSADRRRSHLVKLEAYSVQAPASSSSKELVKPLRHADNVQDLLQQCKLEEEEDSCGSADTDDICSAKKASGPQDGERKVHSDWAVDYYLKERMAVMSGDAEVNFHRLSRDGSFAGMQKTLPDSEGGDESDNVLGEASHDESEKDDPEEEEEEEVKKSHSVTSEKSVVSFQDSADLHNILKDTANGTGDKKHGDCPQNRGRESNTSSDEDLSSDLSEGTSDNDNNKNTDDKNDSKSADDVDSDNDSSEDGSTQMPTEAKLDHSTLDNGHDTSEIDERSSTDDSSQESDSDETSSDEEASDDKMQTPKEVPPVPSLPATGSKHSSKVADTAVSGHKSVDSQRQQELSDKIRLESVKKKQAAMQTQKAVVQAALKAVDLTGSKSFGTHVRFDSDSESSGDEDHSKDEANRSKTKSLSKKLPGLFDSDDDDDGSHDDGVAMETDDGSDEDRFKIKPQFQGKVGEELLKLQGRIGTDSRFKLGEMFMEDEENRSEASEKEEDLNAEKQTSLSVLEGIVGREAMQSVRSKTVSNFRDPSRVRYDPTREDHAHFEVKRDQSGPIGSVSKKKDDGDLLDVSKEVYHEVADLVFSKDQDESQPFRFFAEEEPEAEKADKESGGFSSLQQDILASTTLGRRQLRLDSSDSEDQEEEGMEHDGKDNAMVTSPSNEAESTAYKPFFFQPDDTRLKTGAELFCRKLSLQGMNHWFELQKADLQTEYKKRHQRALRDSKKAAQQKTKTPRR